MPITVTDGLFQIRPMIDPAPIGLTPSSRPVSERRVLSLYSGVSASRELRPSTPTDPSASQSVASSVTVASMASGTAPPNIPEWDA